MKTIQVQRILYPVGHGAFFVEKFLYNNKSFFTVVYDCGSRPDCLVKDCISKAFKIGDYINALFISHFDEDHVNGLKFLTQYVSSDTKVFVPFFYAKYISLYPQKQQKAMRFIIEFLDKKGIQPILIRYSIDDNIKEFNLQKMHVEKNDEVFYINSGSKLRLFSQSGASSLPIWEYVPFNLHDEESLFVNFQKEVFKNKLRIDLKNPYSWNSQQIDELNHIYNNKSLMKYLINENSLLTLSHSLVYIDYIDVKQSDMIFHASKKGRFNVVRKINGSCLYTGDSVLKQKDKRNSKFSKLYNSFMAKLLCYVHHVELFQVPHHGSDKNSNIQTIEDARLCAYFVNHGIKDLKKSSFYLTPSIKNLFFITENSQRMIETMFLSQFPFLTNVLT